MKFTVELTESQRLALIDLISRSLECSCRARVESFIDGTRTPSVTVSASELVKLVYEAKTNEPANVRGEWKGWP